MQTSDAMKFVMQKEPLRPRRSNVHFSSYLNCENQSVLFIISGLVGRIRSSGRPGYDWVNEKTLTEKLDLVYLHLDYDCSPEAHIDLPESDEEFSERQKDYEERLSKYKAWRKKNTAAIEQHEKAEKEKKAAAKAKADKKTAEETERKRKYLQKLLQNTQQKLEKLVKET